MRWSTIGRICGPELHKNRKISKFLSTFTGISHQPNHDPGFPCCSADQSPAPRLQAYLVGAESGQGIWEEAETQWTGEDEFFMKTRLGSMWEEIEIYRPTSLWRLASQHLRKCCYNTFGLSSITPETGLRLSIGLFFHRKSTQNLKKNYQG